MRKPFVTFSSVLRRGFNALLSLRAPAVGAASSPSARAAVVSSAPAAGASLQSGPVDVLSAGSLQDLMQQQISPAFTKATGTP